MKLLSKNAQTAIEYLLLLALVAVIVIAGFSRLLPRVNESVSLLFFKARASIMGAPQADSINGGWCPWSACGCGNGGVPGGDILKKSECIKRGLPLIQNRLCDCPVPLGSGVACSGPFSQSCS